MLSEQLLQMGFDTVLDQPRIDTELIGLVREHLGNGDDETVARLRLGDLPQFGETGFCLLGIRFVISNLMPSRRKPV